MFAKFLTFARNHKKRILITMAVDLCLAIPPLSVKGYYAYRAWRLNVEVERLAKIETEYKQALKAMRAKLTGDQLRQHLAGEYKELVTNENPSLNDIQVIADVVPL